MGPLQPCGIGMVGVSTTTLPGSLCWWPHTWCPTQVARHLDPQALFFLVLGIGVLFLSLLLYITADINLQRACTTVVRRLLKTVALRQVG